MSTATKIEWTRSDDGTAGATWNPVTGCDEVSEGCDNCYARTFAERWRGVPGHPFEQGFDVRLWPDRLELPLRRRKPTRYFVNSMSDLFHESVPDDFIAEVFAVMARAHWHTFQLLTKRHGRMRSLLRRESFRLGLADLAPWPLPNVWLGVSTDNQKWFNIRVPALLETPAAVRFVSAEPLLGPIDLVNGGTWAIPDPPGGEDDYPACQQHGVAYCQQTLPHQGCVHLDWVIVGGESGPRSRPMKISWASSIVAQCQASEVPVFVKQLGRHLGREMGAGPKGGDWDHFPADLRVREFPEARPPKATGLVAVPPGRSAEDRSVGCAHDEQRCCDWCWPARKAAIMGLTR